MDFSQAAMAVTPLAAGQQYAYVPVLHHQLFRNCLLLSEHHMYYIGRSRQSHVQPSNTWMRQEHPMVGNRSFAVVTSP
jgi:hypothetical protein